jgi:hypothetical protein|tara:strand:- start:75 stop:359 length:285 start_codon:yes stop_codon:yes gene_type:complete
MAKISEQFHQDGDKLIHVKQQDWNPMLKQAEEMRQNGNATFGESVCIGVIDQALMGEWLKEAGVKWDDPAAQDVVKRKMLSGEFDKLRVWEGNY